MSGFVEAALVRHQGREMSQGERDIANALNRKAAQPLAGDPTFNLKYETDAIGSDLGYREWEGGVELPLWWPGQSREHKREAERTMSVADAILNARRLEVAGKVRDRFWMLALARGELEQARSALKTTQDLAVDVKRRVDAGELPRSDLLLADKDVLTRADAMAQAENRVTQAERMFTLYTGMESVPAPRREQLSLSKELPENHPQLILVDAKVEQARAHRERVKGERRRGPNVWLGGKSFKEQSGAGYDSAVGVEVSIPLGSVAHAAPASAKAGSALTEAQIEREHRYHELTEALDIATLEYQRTTDAQQRAQRRQELAEASLSISRRAFELGETDLVRLLQVQADAIDARHDQQIRQLDVGQAIARLNQSLGVIPQ
ncbi:MAG: TolC family protein [Pseudomonadota bacterium]|nr:TolC family protein [Pseudomonadota bacterium]